MAESAPQTPRGRPPKAFAMVSHRTLAKFCHQFFYRELTEGPSNRLAQALCRRLLACDMPVPGGDFGEDAGRDEGTVWHAAVKLNEFLAEFSAEFEPFRSTKTRLLIPRGPKGGISFGYWLACLSCEENRYLDKKEIEDLFNGYRETTGGDQTDIEALEAMESLGSTEAGSTYDLHTLLDISSRLVEMYGRDRGMGKAASSRLDIHKVAVSLTSPQNVRWAGTVLNDFSQADRNVAYDICGWVEKEKLADHLMNVLKAVPPGDPEHALLSVWWTMDVIYLISPLVAEQVWHFMDEQTVASTMQKADARVSHRDNGWYLVFGATDGALLEFSWAGLLREGLSWVEYLLDGEGDKG